MFCKKNIIIVVLFLFCSSAYSQNFNGGLLGGLCTSQIDGDTQKGYKKAGLYAGLYVGLDFTNLLGMQIELMYIGKGAKKVINKIEEFNTGLHYLEMPFLLSLKTTDKFKINAGLAGAYLIDSKIVTFSYEEPRNSYDLHNFDWLAVASGQYKFSNNFAVNLRFEYSILPMRTVPHGWFNSNLSLGIVYSIIDNGDRK